MYNIFNKSIHRNFFGNLRGLRGKLNGFKRVNDDTMMQIEEKKEQLKENSNRIAKEVDQDLVISSVSAGIVTAGAFVYPPLTLVALPGLLYQSLDLAQEAFDSLKSKNQVSRAFLDLLVFGLCFSQGYYVLGSLALCSHYFANNILFKSNQEAYQTLSEAIGKEPSMAWLLKDQVEIEVQTKTLQVGQSVVIHPGELVPVDGLIVDGVALVDEHVLGGSAPPSIKNIGERVVCGNILLAGRIIVKIEHVGHSTWMAEMTTELTQATHNQTTLQRWGQRFSPIMGLSQLMGAGLASFMFGPMSIAAMMGARSDYNQIAPLEIITWLEESLQNGIFIRNIHALEVLKQVDTMVIDDAMNQLSAEERTCLINQLRTHKITSVYLLATTSAPEEAPLAVGHYLTKITKQDKVKLLAQLQADGATVCYIGETIEPEIQKNTAVSIGLFNTASKKDSLADILLMDPSLKHVNLLLNMANAFNRQSKNTFITSITPALVALSAPFLFKSGLLVTVALNQIGLLSGLKQAKRGNRADKSLFNINKLMKKWNGIEYETTATLSQPSRL